jgi:histone-lysine N-methyltransferase SETMAR
MTKPDTIQPEQPRTAFKKYSEKFQWELPENPDYSPYLAPSDFHLFGPLKNQLGGKCFTDDEEVETEVQKWLRQQSRDFYAVVFNALVKQ